jgi:hypothetical protein
VLCSRFIEVGYESKRGVFSLDHEHVLETYGKAVERTHRLSISGEVGVTVPGTVQSLVEEYLREGVDLKSQLWTLLATGVITS